MKICFICFYLDGFTTHSNKKTNNYIKSRNELYEFYQATKWVEEKNWNKFWIKAFLIKHFVLGEGKSSVVFTDETSVYKVFLLENYEALGYKRNILNTIQSE